MDQVYAARHKEADKVTVGLFPDAVRYKMWREAVSEDVIAASGRPDDAFRWMMASESRDPRILTWPTPVNSSRST